MTVKRSCLIVDDSAIIRRVVAEMLRDLNFAVSEASTGLGALAHCGDHVPDLIMLDWNMPQMDGITCLHALRALELPIRPIVIMCTSESHLSRIQQALAAGADEYIMKPFDQGVLLDKLTQFALA
jgi:two-component system chemotaxis response regulator CheY